MISASDVLQILNEIHQYFAILLDLGEDSTLGVLRSNVETTSCFKLPGSLTQSERGKLVEAIYSGKMPSVAKALRLDEFLQEIEGKKAKHIWLETKGAKEQEHGFMSIAELKAFFRTRGLR